MRLAEFNALPAEGARHLLGACCASSAWVAAVMAGRPYEDRACLLARAGAALAELDWAGVREALDAHPRIGERPEKGGIEAAWSRREQSAVDGASERTRLELVEANRAYEERFGHVLLIFATGRSGTQLLAAARERMSNDVATERAVVRAELGRIVALRLERMLEA